MKKTYPEAYTKYCVDLDILRHSPIDSRVTCTQCKEVFPPFLTYLFREVADAADGVGIMECVSIDCPSCGSRQYMNKEIASFIKNKIKKNGVQ